MGKVFTATATDDVWDGNTLTDSLSSQQIGILMPNTPINHVQFTYAGGCVAWRLQNAATLTFTRFGFGMKSGLACYESSAIAPYTINPNDILTAYPLPASVTPDTSNVLAWVQTTKGVELFEAKAVANGVSGELTTVVNSQTIGDSMFNSTLQSIHVQAQDGAQVTQVDIVDNSGGTVLTLYGGVRGEAGGLSNLYNLKADGLAVPIGKGFTLNITLTA